jgi:hypothetical protein
MKRCSRCGRVFGVEFDFCLDDGTPLVAGSGLPPPAAFQVPEEVPTQVISRHQRVAASPAGGSNIVLYLIIGIITLALVAVGAFAVLSRILQKPANQAGGPATLPQTFTNNTSPTPAPTIQPTPISAATPMPPLPPSTDRPAAPNGNFSGSLSYPSGSAFSARADLTTNDNGQVRGSIVWTLLRSSNPAKMSKAGSSATEFVQGTFDPATRTVTISGYSKNDPASLIILDKYRLTVSPDGRRLDGVSLGGRTRGTFILTR